MTPVASLQLSEMEIYHLFGFPIAHSASPAFHNYLFSHLELQRTYKLTPMTRIGRKIRALCAAENFGGASVTMPLKVAVACILDRMTVEARAIGAVNTLVRENNADGKARLVGTNTDWLGVRNALLHHLTRIQVSSEERAGLIIGGGGTARAAVYALASLDCTPIYLVGRDASELAATAAQFPHISCIPISDPLHATKIRIAVGCVPSIPPVTSQEIAADKCTRAIFSSSDTATGMRVFLDMCYKPRTTALMSHAAASGWITISGIEAMLEQGLAQARMWLAKSADPQASIRIIPREIEEDARKLIREMPDIIVLKESSNGLDEETEDMEQPSNARL